MRNHLSRGYYFEALG